MRRLVAFVTLLAVGWLWFETAGMKEPLPVELVEGFSLERVCEEDGEAPLFGEFFWDEVRRTEPGLMDEALKRCRRCESAPRCAPVVAVAGWYEAGLLIEETGRKGGEWW